jgi:phage terminase large subunit-like protein
MNWPTKKLEEVVLSGWLRHGGNSVLRRIPGNVSIEKETADNWKPSKKKGRERIDGIVALIMAQIRAITNADAGCWNAGGRRGAVRHFLEAAFSTQFPVGSNE